MSAVPALAWSGLLRFRFFALLLSKLVLLELRPLLLRLVVVVVVLLLLLLVLVGCNQSIAGGKSALPAGRAQHRT